MTFTKDDIAPGTVLYNLQRRYKNMEAREKTGWGSFKEFAKWAMDNGYFINAFLRKKDKNLPFGPDNAYFSSIPDKYPNQRREPVVNESPFCQGCTRIKNPESCGGCKEWEEWFVQTWNRCIYRGPVDKNQNPETEENVYGEEKPDTGCF